MGRGGSSEVSQKVVGEPGSVRVETPVPHSRQQEPEQVVCVWLASLTVVMALRVRWVVYVIKGGEWYQ